MHAMSSAIRSSAFDHRSGSSFRMTDSASPGNNPLGNSPFGSCALSPCLPIHAQRLPFYAKLNPQIPNHPGNRRSASSQRSKKLPRKREKEAETSAIPNEFNREPKRINFSPEVSAAGISAILQEKSPRHPNPDGNQQKKPPQPKPRNLSAPTPPTERERESEIANRQWPK